MQLNNIHISNDALDNLATLIEQQCDESTTIVIVTDTTVKQLYLQTVLKAIERQCHIISIKPGEKNKTRKVKAMIEDSMIKNCCNRNTLMIAFGGGVVGDIAGYVAATYMRGIPYVNIPTTLLSMVDSCIGGKVAINTKAGKNLIGAFWQPQAIIINPSFLKSLLKRQLINGAVEALKMFLTFDSSAVDHFDQHVDDLMLHQEDVVNDIIHRSVKIKSEVTRKDERENELRKVLNFGHTIGHAIEKTSKYNIPHGICVGYGMLVEATISHQMNLLPLHDLINIKNMLAKLHIHPGDLKRFPIDAIIQASTVDKKNRNHQIHCVIIDNIGSYHKQGNKVTFPISHDAITCAWHSIINEEH